jgi:hypothetical protein
VIDGWSTIGVCVVIIGTAMLCYYDGSVAVLTLPLGRGVTAVWPPTPPFLGRHASPHCTHAPPLSPSKKPCSAPSARPRTTKLQAVAERTAQKPQAVRSHRAGGGRLHTMSAQQQSESAAAHIMCRLSSSLCPDTRIGLHVWTAICAHGRRRPNTKRLCAKERGEREGGGGGRERERGSS